MFSVIQRFWAAAADYLENFHSTIEPFRTWWAFTAD
jgi:hypothetical protein